VKKRLFITAVSFRIPGVQSFDGLKYLNTHKLHSQPHFLGPDKSQKLSVHHLDISESARYYPSLKDVKVMREDVLAAAICGQEIFESAQIPAHLRATIPLYMGNGVCLDQLLGSINEISSAYSSHDLGDDIAARHRRVEKATPALFVLNVLTNASQSFVSQYSGAKGDNTVYGNSSHSTVDALEEAIYTLSQEEAEMALVGAANGAGLFFALTFQNLANLSSFDWRLSNAAGMLLIETEESVKKRQATPIAEILSLQKSTTRPSLFSKQELIYNSFQERSQLAYFSGGLGEGDYQLEKKVVEEKWKKAFSYYPIWGCMGVFAPLMNIYGACFHLQSTSENIDCLNNDPYGRSSLIRLGRVV